MLLIHNVRRQSQFLSAKLYQYTISGKLFGLEYMKSFCNLTAEILDCLYYRCLA